MVELGFESNLDTLLEREILAMAFKMIVVDVKGTPINTQHIEYSNMV